STARLVGRKADNRIKADSAIDVVTPDIGYFAYIQSIATGAKATTMKTTVTRYDPARLPPNRCERASSLPTARSRAIAMTVATFKVCIWRELNTLGGRVPSAL